MSTRPGIARGGAELRRIRKLVLDRHGNVCARCSRRIDLKLSGLDPLGLTIGHAIPAALGGDDGLDNLRPEHRRCNLAAGARPDPPRARLARPYPEA